MNPAPSSSRGRGITYAQAGADLNVCLQTVRRLVKRGELQVYRCGRTVRITTESLEAFLARGGSKR